MRIQLMSDLHLEAHPRFRAVPAPGADVLVLAGDIGSYQSGSALLPMGSEPDWGLSQFANWPVPVLFVPGNHEYDGLDMAAADQGMAAACDRLGIRLLNASTCHLELAGQRVRFVGHTLWSDFDALSAEPSYKRASYPNPLARQLGLRAKAYSAANHHFRRLHGLVNGQPQLAEQVRELGLAGQAWLREALAAPRNPGEKTVVITHFAPSLRSADPRYGLQPGTCAFCNAIDELIPQADLWLHGHLHCPSHYTVGNTPVHANPLGYAGNGEQRGFRDWYTVDL
jgi:Icc-related predicted phosphoesterase